MVKNENKKEKNKAEKGTKKKNWHLFYLVGIMAVLSVGVVYFSGSSFGGLTTYLGAPTALAVANPSLKVLPSLGERTGSALFDVVLTVPEKSKLLNPGKELLISVELTNFGEQSTDVDISYLITRADGGEIIFIEHESRTVKVQDQFLKTLALQELPLGKYHVYVHLLYGESTATASGEFMIAS